MFLYLFLMGENNVSLLKIVKVLALAKELVIIMLL